MDRLTALRELIGRMGVAPERRWIAVSGINTHYLIAGSGYPLLLMHGGGAGAIQWYRVIPTLARTFQIIAPDVVGYGETDKPNAAYDRTYFAEWLRDFTNGLGLQRFHLIAASQSGPAALQFALEHESRVDALVMVDSAGFQKRVPVGALLGMVGLYSTRSMSALNWYSRYLVRDPDNLDSALAAYAVGVTRMTGGRRAFWQGKGRAVQPLPESLLCRLSRPLQLVWGQDDRLFALEAAERTIRMLPQAQLDVLPHAGHLSFLEQPAAFCRSLLRVLERKHKSGS